MNKSTSSSSKDAAVDAAEFSYGYGYGSAAAGRLPPLPPRGGGGRRPLARFLDDFRRNKSESLLFPDQALLTYSNSSNTTAGHGHGGGGSRSIDDENRPFVGPDILHSSLARQLKGRHLQMIAISGSIGTGLFILTGQGLATGGPASLLLAFAVVGVNMYCTCHALGELAVVFPIAGSFSSWATRLLDPSWGFALGWNYAIQWLISFPVEVIAASEVVGYWNTDAPRAVFVTIFIVLIITINMFGIKTYGEAEYIFAVVKITAVIGFILFGIILNCAGTPERGYIGFEYWRDPGAFNNGFKGFCTVLLSAAFAFSGTELIGLAAAETANPRKSMPMAIKQVFWRITLFYLSIVLLIGVLLPFNDARLAPDQNQGQNPRSNAKASPLVIAFQDAGLQIFPAIINAVILIAVLSVGNSAVFGSSRTLAALATLRMAPKTLAYIDRRGRPLVAFLVAALVGFVGYLAELSYRERIIDWLTAIGGLSTIFSWGTICACHIQFRRAWRSRGHKKEALPHRSVLGIGGSLIGLVLNVCMIIAQFWVAIFPINRDALSRNDVVKNAALKLLGAFLILLCYLGHKLVYKTKFIKAHTVDVDRGRSNYNVEMLERREYKERSSWPRWKRVYKFLC